MELKSEDLVKISESPIALALVVAIVIMVGLLPVKEAAVSVVAELNDLNTNIEELTGTVRRHERLLTDLSTKVDNLTKERK